MDAFDRVKRAVRDAVGQSKARPPAVPPKEHEAELAMERGDYASAERILANTAAEISAKPQERKRYARIQLLLATALWRGEKANEAKGAAALAKGLLDESQPPVEMSECLSLLGAIASAESDYDQAAAHYAQAAEWSRQTQPENPANTAALLLRRSEALRKTDQFEPAAQTVSQALSLIEERFGKDDLNTADCLVELAQCQRSAGDARAAITSLERALTIFQSDPASGDREITALQQLAEACHAAGELEQAVRHYERVVDRRERSPGHETREAAPLLTQLGGLLSLLGEYGRAIELLQLAVVRLEGSQDPRLGSALDLLGNTYFQFGRFEDAVSCVRRAQGVWESVPDQSVALEANQKLLSDIAGYLPTQRRVALGLMPAPPVEAARARKKPRAPWEVADPRAKEGSPPAQPVIRVGRGAPRVQRRVENPTPVAPFQPDPSKMPPAAGPYGDTARAPGPVPFNGEYGYEVPPGYMPAPAAGGYGSAEGAPVYPVPAGYVPVDASGAFSGPAVYQGDMADGIPWPAGVQPGPGVLGAPPASVQFIRPDGTLIETPPSTEPLHLTVMVDDDLSIPVPAGRAPWPVAQVAALSGWDDLGMEFLTAVKAA